MLLLRLPLLLLLSLPLVSCTASYTPDRQDNKPLPSPIYRVDGNGKLKKDRRMERVRNRGCRDSSTDCGRPFGW